MSITLSNKAETVALHLVKLDKKSDLDIITEAFDCATNPAVPDEAYLDTTCIFEDETLSEKAIEVFGQEAFDALPSGTILFHG